MNEWISVKDRFPETFVDGCRVLYDYLVVVESKYPLKEKVFRDVEMATFVEDDGQIDGKWNLQSDDWIGEDWTGCEECHVTHWMPLPEPPERLIPKAR